MANHFSLLKKRLIKEAFIFTSVIAIVVIIMLLVESYTGDAQSQQRMTEGEVNNNRTRLMQLQKDIASAKDQAALYEVYSKSHNSEFTLNREKTTKWIADQRQKYHLVNMSITISPFTEIKKELFPLKSGTLISSEVKLTFGALSDNSVFAFMSALQRELPGVAAFSDIKINKTSDLSSNVILELNKHNITPLVNAEINFYWIGIRTNETPDNTK